MPALRGVGAGRMDGAFLVGCGARLGGSRDSGGQRWGAFPENAGNGADQSDCLPR